MKIRKFINYGPYGTYEEGMFIEVENGKRVVVFDNGNMAPAKEGWVFKNQKEVTNLLDGVVDVCSNRIAGDEQLQKKLLNLFNPKVVEDFQKELVDRYNSVF